MQRRHRATTNNEHVLKSLMLDALSSVPLSAIAPRETIMKRPETFEVQLPNSDAPPLNQGASGRCWIYSGLNVVGRLMAKQQHKNKKQGAVVPLSHAFVFFHAWLEKCNSALETSAHMLSTKQMPSADWTLMMKNTLSDGGTWDAFVTVIEKHGVVPAAAFPDSVPARASAELNQILNIIVRTAVAEMMQKEMTHRNAVKSKAMQRVLETLQALLGTPPERAVGDMDPRDYFARHVRPCLTAKKFVCLADDPRKPRQQRFWTQYGYTVIDHAKLKRRYGNDLGRYVGNVFWNARSAASLQAAAKRSLDQGCPVWFSCDVRKFYSSKALVMNATASRMDVLTGDDVWTAPKGLLYDSGVIENLHAMTLVGYDAASDTWKIENSWGEVDALVMTSKWFERFVVSIVVPLDCLDAPDRRRAYYDSDADNKNQEGSMTPVWDLYASPQSSRCCCC